MSSTLHLAILCKATMHGKVILSMEREEIGSLVTNHQSVFAHHKSIDFRVRVQILGLHLLVKRISASRSTICEVRMVSFSLQVFRQIRLLRWEDQRSAQHRVHVN